MVEGANEDGDGFGLKGRAASQAPDVDGAVYLKGRHVEPGKIVSAIVTGAGDYDLYVEVR